MTSKEWRDFDLKNGGPEPPTDTATLKNGALQLKNGAPEGQKKMTCLKNGGPGKFIFNGVFSFFPLNSL